MRTQRRFLSLLTALALALTLLPTAALAADGDYDSLTTPVEKAQWVQEKFVAAYDSSTGVVDTSSVIWNAAGHGWDLARWAVSDMAAARAWVNDSANSATEDQKNAVTTLESYYKGLTKLDLSGQSQTGDLGLLAFFTGLKELKLADTALSDASESVSVLTPVALLTDLEVLDISGNSGIVIPDELSKNTKLTSLNISGTGIQNFNFLVKETGGSTSIIHENLKTITAQNLTGLTSLAGLTEIIDIKTTAAGNGNNPVLTGYIWDLSDSMVANSSSAAGATPFDNVYYNIAIMNAFCAAGVGTDYKAPTVTTAANGTGDSGHEPVHHQLNLNLTWAMQQNEAFKLAYGGSDTEVDWATLYRGVSSFGAIKSAYETNTWSNQISEDAKKVVEGTLARLKGYYDGILALTVTGAAGTMAPDMGFMPYLPNLTYLEIKDNPTITQLGALAAVPDSKLETLKLINCTGITNLGGLNGLELETLDISGCTGVADLGALSLNSDGNSNPMTTLHTLNASGSGITSLGGLKDLSALAVLNISNCTGLRDTASSKALGALVENAAALTTLDISGCTGIQDLGFMWKETDPAGPAMTSLTSLTAKNLTLPTIDPLVKVATADGFSDSGLTWDFSGSTLPYGHENEVNAIQAKFSTGTFNPPAVQSKPVTPPITPPGGGSSSGGSSSSDSSSSGGYQVSVDRPSHGSIRVNPQSADKGDTVTITVKPDKGYALDRLTVTDRKGNPIPVTDKGNGKFTFEMPGSKVSIDATFVPVDDGAPDFTDVDADHWAAVEIAWAAESGYMGGYADGTFGPTGSVTRQQLWMILARHAGQAPASMAEAKAWAVANGLSDGSAPGAAVTRQQMVTTLYRYAQRMGYGVDDSADLTAFPDAASVAGYAQAPMAWSVANGIVGGTAQGTLSPSGTATRAQFATILYRFCGQLA